MSVQTPPPPIPSDWIKRYVDQWLEVADHLKPDGANADSPMYRAALLRAEYAMDLVEAWRASDEANR